MPSSWSASRLNRPTPTTRMSIGSGGAFSSENATMGMVSPTLDPQLLGRRGAEERLVRTVGIGQPPLEVDRSLHGAAEVRVTGERQVGEGFEVGLAGGRPGHDERTGGRDRVDDLRERLDGREVRVAVGRVDQDVRRVGLLEHALVGGGGPPGPCQRAEHRAAADADQQDEDHRRRPARPQVRTEERSDRAHLSLRPPRPQPAATSRPILCPNGAVAEGRSHVCRSGATALGAVRCVMQSPHRSPPY